MIPRTMLHAHTRSDVCIVLRHVAACKETPNIDEGAKSSSMFDSCNLYLEDVHPAQVQEQAVSL